MAKSFIKRVMLTGALVQETKKENLVYKTTLFTLLRS
jgi:hypothetical protein